MALQDDTTFEDLRQKTELYEQVSQRWMSEGGLEWFAAVSEAHG